MHYSWFDLNTKFYVWCQYIYLEYACLTACSTLWPHLSQEYTNLRWCHEYLGRFFLYTVQDRLDFYITLSDFCWLSFSLSASNSNFIAIFPFVTLLRDSLREFSFSWMLKEHFGLAILSAIFLFSSWLVYHWEWLEHLEAYILYLKT